MLKTVEYKNDELIILDQTLLPTIIQYEALRTDKAVFEAIKKLKVRGAPLIGVVAAYGVLIGTGELKNSPDLLQEVERVCRYLNEARPTAVNLSWALTRMLNKAKSTKDVTTLYKALTLEAQAIHEEDAGINKRIGEHTYELIKGKIRNNSITIMTHCNAGALATTGYGTATSVMYLLKERGVEVKVFTCETRPLLQGARLTAFELMDANIDTTLITDNMAAAVLSEGMVDFVIVGADRVAANLDTANKIGTLGLSIIAKQYKVPFYVACPSPTFDENTKTGKDIIIEQRSGDEITTLGGLVIAPKNVKTYNPSFDVTPSSNITAVITEHGIMERQI